MNRILDAHWFVEFVLEFVTTVLFIDHEANSPPKKSNDLCINFRSNSLRDSARAAPASLPPRVKASRFETAV